jgi:hypothetical protein
MPFELGLVVALEKLRPGEHDWFVFESRKRRLQKSLSDLGGTDVYIHTGRASGLFRELCNALVIARRQPTVQQMAKLYGGLVAALPGIMRRAGATSAFEARPFTELVVTSRALAHRVGLL